METRIRKEFILEMQAKGKLPRIHTEALERRDEAYFNNADRIFPAGPGGMDSVIADMIRQTEKRMNDTSRRIPEGQLSSPSDQRAREPTISDPSQFEKDQRKRELKDRLRRMELDLAEEKKRISNAEGQISVLKLI